MRVDNAVFDTSVVRAEGKGSANLADANLSGVDLTEANLTDAKYLTQTQLDRACGTDAKLPPGLTLQPCSGVATSTPHVLPAR